MNNTSRSSVLQGFERKSQAWVAKNGASCLRISIGIVFLWFGALKLFPDLSPAQELAGQTISTITFGLLPPQISVPLLGDVEVLLGSALLLGVALRLVILALLVHMLGTGLPLFLFPTRVFGPDLLTLTFEGQYIIKNLVIISGALVVGTQALRPKYAPSLHRSRRDSVLKT